MRTAAEKRVEGVTAHKRRRVYGQAALLVAVGATLDPSPERATWAASFRTRFRRFPAFQGDLAEQLGEA